MLLQISALLSIIATTHAVAAPWGNAWRSTFTWQEVPSATSNDYSGYGMEAYSWDAKMYGALFPISKLDPIVLINGVGSLPRNSHTCRNNTTTVCV